MSPTSAVATENRAVLDEAFLRKARGLRPFYFIVVVWGERYVDFLLNFCVASLLAPGNIPALANRGRSKFLIATTDEDWALMQDRPIFRKLAEYVEPVKILIPPCPPGVSGCVHMGIGHKLATQVAFEDRAYAVLLTPDLMLSDGTMAAAQRHAVDGVHVVLCAALRFGEEPLFKSLEELGVANIGSQFGNEARALIATGRQLVQAGIKSFHSETLRYQWDVPYFSAFPVACWWPVPGEGGILVHCLSWAPLLIDYDAVIHHDSSMMDNWTIDGDYVYRNYGSEGKVYVVQDSDEMMLVSWAPLSDREQSLEPHKPFALPLVGDWVKGVVLHETYNNPVFDPLKRKIFFLPVRWHSKDLNRAWKRVERRASWVLASFLGHPLAAKKRFLVRFTQDANGWLMRFTQAAMGWIVRFKTTASWYRDRSARFPLLFVKAVRGDPDARQRIRFAWRFLLMRLFGIPMS